MTNPIRQRRREKDLTQLECSDMIGISRASWSARERRFRTLKFETLAEMCKVLDLDARKTFDEVRRLNDE
jgi:transcriptional regulator with XRE-family HTH domain